MRRLKRAGQLAGWLTLACMAGASALGLLVAMVLRPEAGWTLVRESDEPAMLTALLLLALVTPLLALAVRLARAPSGPCSPTGFNDAAPELAACDVATAEAARPPAAWHDEPRILRDVGEETPERSRWPRQPARSGHPGRHPRGVTRVR